MTNVEGMTFQMGMYPQLPLSPPVACMFFLTFISTGSLDHNIYCISKNTELTKSSKGLWQYKIAV